MKRLDLWLAAMLVLTCFAWFALYEVYYDGGPMPALPALGGLFVILLPMFLVYLAKELMRHRRWPSLWAWLWAFAAFSIITTSDILVQHYKPNCDRCHMEIEWDLAIIIPIVFVYTGVVNAVDAAVARIMQNWKWCMANRHLILRLIVRLVLTSSAALILMRILYEVANALRMY
jgi:FtsH-binding integral membrane protein